MPTCRYCHHHTDDGRAVILWDGEPYCPSCVETVCPELADLARSRSALSETITGDRLRLGRLLVHPAVLLCFAIFLGPWVLVLAFGPSKHQTAAMLCMAACAVPCAGLIGVFMFQYYFGPKGRMPRTVSVQDGQLRVTDRKDEWTVPLSECAWHPGSSHSDVDLFTLPKTPMVVLSTPGRAPVACGVTPESRRVWEGFLTLSGIHCRGRFPTLHLLVACLLGPVVGGVLGAALGWLVATATGNEQWVDALIVLGAMDGLVIPLVVIIWPWFAPGATRPEEWRWSDYPLRFALMCAALGLLVAGSRRGMGLGLINALAVAAINAPLGWLAGWYVARRVRSKDPTSPSQATVRNE